MAVDRPTTTTTKHTHNQNELETNERRSVYMPLVCRRRLPKPNSTLTCRASWRRRCIERKWVRVDRCVRIVSFVIIPLFRVYARSDHTCDLGTFLYLSQPACVWKKTEQHFGECAHRAWFTGASYSSCCLCVFFLQFNSLSPLSSASSLSMFSQIVDYTVVLPEGILADRAPRLDNNVVHCACDPLRRAIFFFFIIIRCLPLFHTHTQHTSGTCSSHTRIAFII